MITVNDVLIEPTVFPDGTTQVWKLPEHFVRAIKTPVIEWTYSNDAEIFSIAQLKLLFDMVGRVPELFINYLPYGRQDKKVSNTATFGLHAFAKLIDTLEFRRVVILDPHSSEYKLIRNSEAYFPNFEVEELFRALEIDSAVYPDSGAQLKYGQGVYKFQSISARKNREPLEGEIGSLVLNQSDAESLLGKRVLIVDDICDGGATFIKLAGLLKKAGVSYIGLYVTYGLFTKGIKVLKEAGIDDVYYAKRIGEEIE